MKILVAEDDLVTRELLKRILSHMSDEIVEAGDGLEALEMIEKEDPDFLFTDLQMPELGGYELVEAVRNSKKHSQLPVVCMSSVKEKDEVTRVVALGVQDYILKPIRPAEVHDRFRKVIAQHSGWRRRQGAKGARTLMLVDADPNFREFARTFLEGAFTVVEAASGAHALRVYKEADAKPNIVLAAHGLPLVNEVQLKNLITRMAMEGGGLPPSFWLCADETPTRDTMQHFVGVVHRSFVPDVFTAELKRTLLHGHAPIDKLRIHFAEDARRWSLNATRQTLGVMSGQEVKTLDVGAATEITEGVAGRITLSRPDLSVVVVIACASAEAIGLASKVLKREVTLEAGGLDVFGELSNSIGGRARAALMEAGFDLTVSQPEVLPSYTSNPSERWDLADWFETEEGSRFFVGMRCEEGQGPPPDSPEPRTEVPADTVAAEDAAL